MGLHNKTPVIRSKLDPEPGGHPSTHDLSDDCIAEDKS